VVNADGSTTTTVTETNRDGSLRDKNVTAISANGLSKTTQVDVTGDGVFDLTTTDVTVINADGSRTETTTDTNANGTLRNRTVVTRGADGRSRTVQADVNGDGQFDHVESIVVAANGSSVDTVSNFNPNGSLNNKMITTTSADGLTTTVQMDLNGDAVVDLTRTLMTVRNADGSSTTTQSDNNANSSLRDRIVTTTSADGLSTTVQVDQNGDGVTDLTTTDVTVVNTDGSRVETIAERNTDGSLHARAVTTTSADRKSTTVTRDFNGDSAIDETETINTLSNGSVVDTVSDLNPDGSLRDKRVTTTSANGLSTTVQTDRNGDGIFDLTTTDVTVLSTDGSRTETVTRQNANGSVRGRAVTTTSATGLSTTIQADLDGDGLFDRTSTEVTSLNADGSRTETVTRKSANAAVISKSVVTTSANGLSTTPQADLNGDGAFDRVLTDVTVLNANGSRTETITDRNGDGSLHDQTVTSISADGRSITIQSNTNGDNALDQTETIATVANGSVVDTVVDLNPNGTTKDSSTTTTSADGRTRVTTTDLNVDGVVDKTSSYTTVLNADGTTTDTYNDYAGSTLTKTKRVVTSADGRTITTTRDLDGNGTTDLTRSNVTVVNADGSQVVTVTDKNGNGSQRYQTLKTTSADGKTISITRRVNGDSKSDMLWQGTDGTPAVWLMNGTNILSTVSFQWPSWPIKGTGDFNGDGHSDILFQGSDGTPAIWLMDGTNILSVAGLPNPGPSWQIKGTGDFNGDGKSDLLLQNSDDGTPGIWLMNGTSVVGAGVPASLSTWWQIKGTGDFNGDGKSDIVLQGLDGTPAIWLMNGTSIVGGAGLPNPGASWQIKGTGDFNGDGKSDILLQNSDDGTPGIWLMNGTSVVGAGVPGSSGPSWQVLGSGNFNRNGTIDQRETIVIQANGSKVDTISNLNPNGSLKSKKITTTSANGLSTVIQLDVNGDGTIDETLTIVLNADGSRIETLADYGATGVIKDQVVTTTSANGLSQTIQWSGANGQQSLNQTQTDATVLNADGSRTETISDTTPSGVLWDRKIITTSANGLSETTQLDTDGNGSLDRVDAIAHGLDGSKTETITKTNPVTGALEQRDVFTTSADGRTQSLQRDFGGNGASIALQGSDGTPAVWLTNGLNVASEGTVGWGPAWPIKGTGDFNGDGKSDILFQGSDGTPAIWLMNGTNIIGGAGLPGPAWPIKGTGDFNGDGKSDILFQGSDGTPAIWLMDGTNILGGGALPGPSWPIVGTGDFNGDGKSDILLQGSDGTPAIWLMNGINVLSMAGLPNIGASWQVKGTGDFNGDGKSDILWQNSTDGTAQIWLMNGTSIVSGGTLGWYNLGPSWQIKGIGNFNNDAVAHHYETTVTNSDGSTTTTTWNTTTSGAVNDKVIATKSADGLTTEGQVASNGDGAIDYSWTTATTLNADGTKTETSSWFNASGHVWNRAVATTSANGLSKTTQFDTNGDGVVDELRTDVTVLNADGSTTETASDLYSVNGSLKRREVTTISADDRIKTTQVDADGNGVLDKVVYDVFAGDGTETRSTNYFNANGTLKSWISITAGFDGHTTTVQRSTGVTETTTVVADSSGSYSWVRTGAGNSLTGCASHTIDAAGVDTWTWNENPSVNANATIRIDLATEARYLDIAKRLYDTVFDRDMFTSEKELLAKYVTNGALNAAPLANDLISSTEFSQKYGSLSNVQFIERLYQNTFGHAASLADVTNYLSRLIAGTMRPTDVMIAISESAEHLAVGKVHAVTNNTDTGDTTYTLDHTMDKNVAGDAVTRLYDTVFNRNASPSEVTYWTQQILSGSMTVAQIAAALATSPEFTANYGNSSNSDLVSRIFQNSFDRLPSSAESQFWTTALNAGTVSRADFLTGLAQSTDHMGSSGSLIGGPGNDILISGPGNDTLVGNGGNDIYKFGRGNGQDQIINGTAANTGSSGELDFGAGIASNQLWFMRTSGGVASSTGSDLQIDVMGANDHVTVADWYSDPYAPLSEIVTPSGLKVDSGLAQLVQAMAVYSANNPGFNPTTVSQVPNDSSLQTALASAWHQ